jgi:hypothetical protein
MFFESLTILGLSKFDAGLRRSLGAEVKRSDLMWATESDYKLSVICLPSKLYVSQPVQQLHLLLRSRAVRAQFSLSVLHFSYDQPHSSLLNVSLDIEMLHGWCILYIHVLQLI